VRGVKNTTVVGFGAQIFGGNTNAFEKRDGDTEGDGDRDGPSPGHFSQCCSRPPAAATRSGVPMSYFECPCPARLCVVSKTQVLGRRRAVIKRTSDGTCLATMFTIALCRRYFREMAAFLPQRTHRPSHGGGVSEAGRGFRRSHGPSWTCCCRFRSKNIWREHHGDTETRRRRREETRIE